MLTRAIRRASILSLLVSGVAVTGLLLAGGCPTGPYTTGGTGNTGLTGKFIDIMLGGDYVMSANIGKKGLVKLSKRSKMAKMLEDAINMKEDLRIVPKEQ